MWRQILQMLDNLNAYIFHFLQESPNTNIEVGYLSLIQNPILRYAVLFQNNEFDIN